MKKIGMCLVLTLGILLGFTVNAQAVNAATLTKTKSGYYYDRARADGTDHHSWYFMQYEMDGEVSYCIEPNIPEGTIYNPGSWEATGLPNEIKERLLLIGYYGYTYPGHQTLQYRAATQGMIWDIIIGHGANTTFLTERWGAGSDWRRSRKRKGGRNPSPLFKSSCPHLCKAVAAILGCIYTKHIFQAKHCFEAVDADLKVLRTLELLPSEPLGPNVRAVKKVLGSLR